MTSSEKELMVLLEQQIQETEAKGDGQRMTRDSEWTEAVGVDVRGRETVPDKMPLRSVSPTSSELDALAQAAKHMTS